MSCACAGRVGLYIIIKTIMPAAGRLTSIVAHSDIGYVLTTLRGVVVKSMVAEGEAPGFEPHAQNQNYLAPLQYCTGHWYNGRQAVWEPLPRYYFWSTRSCEQRPYPLQASYGDRTRDLSLNQGQLCQLHHRRSYALVGVLQKKNYSLNDFRFPSGPPPQY